MKTSHVGSPQCSQRALEGAVNEFKFTHGGNLTSEGRAESAVVNGRFTLSTGGDLKTLALLPEARECLLLVAKW